MSLSTYELLQHIRDEVDYLLDKTNGQSFEEFVNDPTLIRAYARSLEIIGEATKKIPAKFKESYQFVEWKGMAGLRDKLIHDYFGIDFELVWDILQHKIPTLKTHLNQIFKDFDTQN